MTSYPREQITLGLLAGGQGLRMGGQDKGLLNLGEHSLVDHVLQRCAPQTSQVLINANRNIEQYQAFGYPVIQDQRTDFAGPLAGAVALLEAVKTPWLLVVPCDTPDLPETLAERLYLRAQQTDAQIVMAHDGTQDHPVVALIKKELAPMLKHCLEQGQRKIVKCYRQHRLEEADFSDTPDAFMNLNSPLEWAFLLGQKLASRAKHLNSKLVMPAPLLGIAAWSGVGKTQLLTQLLPRLNASGLRVAIVKHAHHDFDPDLPGKDSYKLRKAGACQMLVASNQRWALVCEDPVAERPNLQHLLDQLDAPSVDLVLVEGFKQTPMAKLELHRPEIDKPLLYPEDPSIIAIACPNSTALQQPPVRLDLNQIDVLAQFVIGYQQQMSKDSL